MTVRQLRVSDGPILQSIAAKSGFPYPELDHPHIEAVLVVVDSEDKPLIACAAKRLIEIYGWVDSEQSPAVLIEAWKLLHEGMSERLRDLGYHSAEAFLPPSVSTKFGRRLERTFRWVKNWPSWTLKF